MDHTPLGLAKAIVSMETRHGKNSGRKSREVTELRQELIDLVGEKEARKLIADQVKE